MRASGPISLGVLTHLCYCGYSLKVEIYVRTGEGVGSYGGRNDTVVEVCGYGLCLCVSLCVGLVNG